MGIIPYTIDLVPDSNWFLGDMVFNSQGLCMYDWVSSSTIGICAIYVFIYMDRSAKFSVAVICKASRAIKYFNN